MTDDDLTRRLEAWAEATDPAADPVTASEVTTAEVTAADDVVFPPARPRRLLAVAAVLLAVLAVGAAVVVTRSDDGAAEDVIADEEVGDPADPTGPRTQIVVIAHLEATDPPEAHRFAVEPTCAPRASCVEPDGPPVAGPLLPGTSLVAEMPLGRSRWVFRYEAVGCGADGCGPPAADGALAAGDDPLVGCTVDLPASAPAGRPMVVRVVDLAEGPPTCAADPTGSSGPLSVPPAWSVREPLPWSCGSGAWDTRRVGGPRDRPGLAETLECFADAVETGTPAEVLLGDASPDPTEGDSWLRTGGRGPDGQPIEVLHQPPADRPSWTRSWCSRVDVSEVDHEAVGASTPGGPPATTAVLGRWTEAMLFDCTEPEDLSLDLPPADEPAPTSEPGTTSEPVATPPPFAGAPFDVVLDLQPPGLPDGQQLEWWSLVLEDGSVVEDLAGEPIVLGGTRQRALVAEDVAVPSGGRVGLTWGRHPCDGACPVPTAGGRPSDGRAAVPVCTVELPTGSPVVVVTLADDTCGVVGADGLPDLTVPPAWSRRERLPRPCGIEGTDGVDENHDAIAGRTEVIRRCFVDAATAGEDLEMRSPLLADEDAPDGRSWRARDGVVTVIAHGDPVTGEGWTSQTCDGIVEIAEDPFMEGTGCGPVTPMSLTA